MPHTTPTLADGDYYQGLRLPTGSTDMLFSSALDKLAVTGPMNTNYAADWARLGSAILRGC